MSSEPASTSAADDIVAAWRIIGDLLRAGLEGQTSLKSLLDPNGSIDSPQAWAALAPLTFATRTTVTGGVIEKLTNIAHAEAVYLGYQSDPVVKPPAQLPVDAGPFTGRKRFLGEILKLLGDSDRQETAVVVITGQGGIGKTRLALRAAHLLRDQYVDGQLYLNLKGVDRPPPTSSDLLGAFLRALLAESVKLPDNEDERLALLRTHLATRHVLILLDNAASVRQVQRLLPGVGRCAVLITSRANLSELEPTRTFNLDVLSESNAVDLLQSVIGDGRVAKDPHAARDIVRLCGYFPLAVHIAGRRMARRPHWRLSGLVSRLRDERNRLNELALDDLEIRSAFNLSYAILNQTQKQCFRHLSLVRAPHLSVRHVSWLMNSSVDAAEDIVESLAEAHLVRNFRPDGAGQLRFDLHDLVLLFSSERSEVEDTAHSIVEAKRRVYGGYLSSAEKLAHELRPLLPANSSQYGDIEGQDGFLGNFGNVLTTMKEEKDCLVSIIGQAIDEGEYVVATGLAKAIHSYFLLCSDDDQWLETQRAGLRAARLGRDASGEALLLRNLAEAHRNRGSYDEAAELARTSAAALQSFGLIDDADFALLISADILRYQGRPEEAVRGLEECVDRFTSRGNQRGCAYALMDLGSALRTQENWVRAATCFDTALVVIREYGDEHLESHVLRELGCVLRDQGNLGQAERLLTTSLAMAREQAHSRAEGYSLRELGVTQMSLGQSSRAANNLREACAIFAQIRDVYGLAYANQSLGLFASAAGEVEQAVIYLEKSLGGMRAIGDKRGLALTLLELGLVQAKQARIEDARLSIAESTELFAKLGIQESRLRALAALESLGT